MVNDSIILSGSEDGSVYCWDLIEVRIIEGDNDQRLRFLEGQHRRQTDA